MDIAMIRRGELPELLSPAGDFDSLVAAVAAGADAVYLGAKEFSARAFAKNFYISELDRAVRYCHLFGVRLYVTVNTLLSTKELPRAVELARELYFLGVDALIVSDLGLIRELRRELPGFELHASTQLSVHNLAGADAAMSMGLTRVVLARELSLENMTEVTSKSKAECEVFVHGALCVSHSGQCLFSSLVGGRSGNRGECAQPCRLNYNGDKYPLSLKDLSLALHIPELISAGVSSLKIEGRMKAPGYVYNVTRVFRALLDEGRSASDTEMDMLSRVFSRSGFTDGYFTGKMGGMTGTRRKSDIDATRALSDPDCTPRRAPVRMHAIFREGAPATVTLELIGSDRSVTVFGDEPRPAERHPLTRDELVERLSKMGNTFLLLYKEDIDIELDEGINLSPSSINSLRRLAADSLETFERPVDKEEKKEKELPVSVGSRLGITAEFLIPELYFSLDNATRGRFDTVFLPLSGIESYEYVSEGVSIPPVFTDSEASELQRLLSVAKERGVNYALVGNIGALTPVRDAGLIPIAGFRMNIMNSSAKLQALALGFGDITLSAELTLPAAAHIGGRVIVYGRIPLMLTERCFISENFGCKRCESSAFEDRRGEKFPVIREWRHRNLILNSRPTYMGDKRAELLSRRSLDEHFIFSVETKREAESAVHAYFSGKRLGDDIPHRRMGRREPD